MCITTTSESCHLKPCLIKVKLFLYHLEMGEYHDDVVNIFLYYYLEMDEYESWLCKMYVIKICVNLKGVCIHVL